MKIIRFICQLSPSKQLLLLFLGLFFLFGLNHTFSKGPKPIHQWRKADSLSITLNYSKGTPFLNPQTNYVNEAGNRFAGSEFPIVYYAIGKLWQIFGQSEFLYRILGLTLLLFSILKCHLIIVQLLKSKWLAIFVSTTIFLSPVLVKYSNAFIPNSLAFSFLLLGLCAVYKYLTESKTRYLFIQIIVFFALACLIKITVLIAVLSFAGAGSVWFLFKNKKSISLKKTALHLSIVFVVVVAILIAWYKYIIYFNAMHESYLFSTTIRPLWEVDVLKQKEIFEAFLKGPLKLYFHPVFLGVVFSVSVGLLFVKNSLPLFLKALIVFSTLGVLSYFVIWFWVFDVHDYYLIEIVFYPIILLFSIIFYLKNKSFFIKPIIKIGFVSIFLINAFYCASYTRMSFGLNDNLVKNSPFLTKEERSLYRWYYFNDRNTIGKLRNAQAIIDRHIHIEEPVICIPDISPNFYLYTINRNGYSGFETKANSIHDITKRRIKNGAKHLIVVGEVANYDAYKPFVENLVDSLNGVKIFTLKELK